MAETKKGAAKSAPNTSFPLTLEEFMARASAEDNRVELLAGFYHTEQKAGHLRDTHDAFAERLQAFETQPVK